MDISTAGRTVSTVLPLTMPEVAEMVVVPTATVVARPPAAIVAAAGFVDAQVTVAVRFCVEPSEYVPVAVNCWVSPAATLGVAGVTVMDDSVGSTVSVALPVTPLSVAEMAVVPAATVVARPPAAIVAAAVFVDAHVTW
jgi:hypothetical protein